MDELTPDQYTRLAGLGLIGWEGLEILRLLRVERLSVHDAASRLCMDVPQLERRYQDATERALEALAGLLDRSNGNGARRRELQDLLDVIRGPVRHNPSAGVYVVDKYRSTPTETVYRECKLRGRIVVPEDLMGRGR